MPTCCCWLINGPVNSNQSGKVAEEWIAEFKSGGKNFAKIREEQGKHSIEETGEKIRGMFEKKEESE